VAACGRRVRALFGRPQANLVQARLSGMERRVVAAFAYDQADQIRDGALTREQAIAAIAQRFPRLTPAQVRDALARGLQESR
jgi:hypothetical protein